MKLQTLTICGLLAAPLALAEGDKNQKQHEKRWGDGTCLPTYLALYDVDGPDGQGDGVISEEERQVMEQARAQIRKQLRTDWDANGDGQLSDQEKEQARTRLREMIEECRLVRFNEADVDDDGALSYDEFKTLPGMANKLPEDEAKVQEIFDRLDADDSGTITAEEFLAAVRDCDRLRDGSGTGTGPKDR